MEMEFISTFTLTFEQIYVIVNDRCRLIGERHYDTKKHSGKGNQSARDLGVTQTPYLQISNQYVINDLSCLGTWEKGTTERLARMD